MLNNGYIETIRVRAISVGFAVLALGVFKPFGLGAWQWDVFFHLLIIWMLGLGVCMLTEIILKYLVRMPRSYEQGVSYIIRRNLWFQIVNTPLISLAICLYRHFVLSERMPDNRLSWNNFFETLIILVFISFAIGLYWRFKFRSRYLAEELEETQRLNIQLKELQQAAEIRAEKAESVIGGNTTTTTPATSPAILQDIILTGTTNERVTLQISDLLYIESVGNYVKVRYLQDNQVKTDMLRATSKQMENTLRGYPMIVRCHRAFLVNLNQVEQIVSKSGRMKLIIHHSHESIPVSRSNTSGINSALKKC